MNRSEEDRFQLPIHRLRFIRTIASVRLIGNLLLAFEGVGQPVQTFVQTVTGGSAGGLDVPLAVGDRVQAKLIGNLADRHGVGEILLVGEDKEDSITQFILLQHLLELLVGLRDTLTIVGVNNENKTLGVLEVVAPQGTDLVLTSDIPHGEADVLVLDSFDVEPNSGDSGDDLAQLQLVQDGGLTGSIETDHKDTHLLLTGEELGENVSHCE